MVPRPPDDIAKHRSKILRTQLLIGESVTPADLLRVSKYEDWKYLVHLKAQIVLNENWEVIIPTSFIIVEWKDIDAPTIFSDSYIANMGAVTEQDELSLIGYQLFHWTTMYIDTVAILRAKGFLVDRSLVINTPYTPVPSRFSRLFLE